MTLYTPIATPVRAWRFERAEMPAWLFDLHAENRVRFERLQSADPLITVCGRYVLSAKLGDWIVLAPGGDVQVWSDAMFSKQFRPLEAAEQVVRT